MAPGLDEFDVLLEVVLSLVRVQASMCSIYWAVKQQHKFFGADSVKSVVAMATESSY